MRRRHIHIKSHLSRRAGAAGDVFAENTHVTLSMPHQSCQPRGHEVTARVPNEYKSYCARLAQSMRPMVCHDDIPSKCHTSSSGCGCVCVFHWKTGAPCSDCKFSTGRHGDARAFDFNYGMHGWDDITHI